MSYSNICVRSSNITSLTCHRVENRCNLNLLNFTNGTSMAQSFVLFKASITLNFLKNLYPHPCLLIFFFLIVDHSTVSY